MSGSSPFPMGERTGGWPGAVLAVAAVAYPVLLFAGVTAWEPRTAGRAFLVLAGVLALLALADRGARPAAVAMLLPATVLGAGTFALSGDLLLLAFPTLVSVALAMPFAWSLLPGRTPLLVEFARMHRRRMGLSEVLPPVGHVHCRRFTVAWTLVLVTNGAIAAALAFLADRTVWATYACGISYLLLGALFLVEMRGRPAPSEPTRRLAADDPWFAGHFEGDPLMPAVALLTFVERALHEHAPGARVRGVDVARFRRPVVPGDAIRVELDDPLRPPRTRFRVVVGDDLASHGVIRFDVPASA